jgi:hypothetical protein
MNFPKAWAAMLHPNSPVRPGLSPHSVGPVKAQAGPVAGPTVISLISHNQFHVWEDWNGREMEKSQIE